MQCPYVRYVSHLCMCQCYFYVSIEYLCAKDGSLSDESIDDESGMTVKGNLHQVEQV